MNFDKILKDIIDSVEGAKAALIMGFDGISVAKINLDDSIKDLEHIAVEYTKVISEISKASSLTGCGKLIDVAITTDNHYLVFYVLPENYFMALLLSERAYLGKGRYILKMFAGEVISEL